MSQLGLLGKLPLEVRELIFTYCLSSGYSELVLYQPTWPHPSIHISERYRYKFDIALFRVQRQLAAEAKEVFIKSNCFIAVASTSEYEEAWRWDFPAVPTVSINPSQLQYNFPYCRATFSISVSSQSVDTVEHIIVIPLRALPIYLSWLSTLFITRVGTPEPLFAEQLQHYVLDVRTSHPDRDLLPGNTFSSGIGDNTRQLRKLFKPFAAFLMPGTFQVVCDVVDFQCKIPSQIMPARGIQVLDYADYLLKQEHFRKRLLDIYATQTSEASSKFIASEYWQINLRLCVVANDLPRWMSIQDQTQQCRVQMNKMRIQMANFAAACAYSAAAIDTFYKSRSYYTQTSPSCVGYCPCKFHQNWIYAMPELFNSPSQVKSLGLMWYRLDHLRAVSHHLRPLRSELCVLLDRLCTLRAKEGFDPFIQHDISSLSRFWAAFGSFDNAINLEHYLKLLEGISYHEGRVRLFAGTTDRDLRNSGPGSVFGGLLECQNDSADRVIHFHG